MSRRDDVHLSDVRQQAQHVVDVGVLQVEVDAPPGEAALLRRHARGEGADLAGRALGLDHAVVARVDLRDAVHRLLDVDRARAARDAAVLAHTGRARRSSLPAPRTTTRARCRAA